MSKRARAARLVGEVVELHGVPFEVLEVAVSAPDDVVLGARGPGPHLCLRVRRIVAAGDAQVLLFKVRSRVRYERVDRGVALDEARFQHTMSLFAWLRGFVDVQEDVDGRELDRRVRSMREAFAESGEEPKMEFHLHPFAALARAVLIAEYRSRPVGVAAPR